MSFIADNRTFGFLGVETFLKSALASSIASLYLCGVLGPRTWSHHGVLCPRTGFYTGIMGLKTGSHNAVLFLEMYIITIFWVLEHSLLVSYRVSVLE